MAMTAWEYVFLDIEGHGPALDGAKNMVVTTSDGHWQRTKMPKDVRGIVNELGGEGWEMVNSSSARGMSTSATPHYSFEAVFTRPKP